MDRVDKVSYNNIYSIIIDRYISCRMAGHHWRYYRKELLKCLEIGVHRDTSIASVQYRLVSLVEGSVVHCDLCLLYFTQSVHTAHTLHQL